MNTAACPAITSYIKLTSGAANLIIRFGTEIIRNEDRIVLEVPEEALVVS
ncbi:MAG: hypothetical protein AAB112_07260 [Thermodesulfobacteriota bacterium]